jgi:hydrogenase-4 component B
MAGALALAAFLKACAVIFLGAPRTRPAAEAHECGAWMLVPMLALAGACVVLGITPLLVWPAVSRVAEVWRPGWAAGSSSAPLGTLSLVHAGLAILTVIAAAWLWRKVRAGELRRGPTWDCGYAAPAARMQYSSGSFAGIVSGWFSRVLRPERRWRRPRGHFPAEAILVERVPDTVLERVITPVAGLIMQLSTAVRRLQHGRLPAYILYLVAGLVALVIVVLTGVAP